MQIINTITVLGLAAGLASAAPAKPIDARQWYGKCTLRAKNSTSRHWQTISDITYIDKRAAEAKAVSEAQW